MGLNTNINKLLIIIGCLPSRWPSCSIVQKTSVPCRNCFWKQIYDLTALWDLLVDLLKRKVKSFSLKKQFLLLEMERKRGSVSVIVWEIQIMAKRDISDIFFPPDSMTQLKKAMFWTPASSSSVTSFLLQASQREICLFFHGSQVAFVLLTINHLKIKDQI